MSLQAFLPRSREKHVCVWSGGGLTNCCIWEDEMPNSGREKKGGSCWRATFPGAIIHCLLPHGMEWYGAAVQVLYMWICTIQEAWLVCLPIKKTGILVHLWWKTRNSDPCINIYSAERKRSLDDIFQERLPEGCHGFVWGRKRTTRKGQDSSMVCQVTFINDSKHDTAPIE